MPFRHIELKSRREVSCDTPVFSKESQAYVDEAPRYFSKRVQDMQMQAGSSSHRPDYLMKELSLPDFADHVAKVSPDAVLGALWYGPRRGDDAGAEAEAAAAEATPGSPNARPPALARAGSSWSLKSAPPAASPPPKLATETPKVVGTPPAAADADDTVSVTSSMQVDCPDDDKVGGTGFTKMMRKCNSSKERLELLLRKLPLADYLKGAPKLREVANSQVYLTNGLLSPVDIKLLRNHLKLVLGVPLARWIHRMFRFNIKSVSQSTVLVSFWF